MLKPSVKQMLMIGKDMGYETVEVAYSDYMRHYDCFFLIEDFQNQNKEFTQQIIDYGLVIKEGDGSYSFKDLTVNEALRIIGETNAKP